MKSLVLSILLKSTSNIVNEFITKQNNLCLAAAVRNTWRQAPASIGHASKFNSHDTREVYPRERELCHHNSCIGIRGPYAWCDTLTRGSVTFVPLVLNIRTRLSRLLLQVPFFQWLSVLFICFLAYATTWVFVHTCGPTYCVHSLVYHSK